MTYLVDTSALTRILRRQVGPDWEDFDRRGSLAVAVARFVPELKQRRISAGPAR